MTPELPNLPSCCRAEQGPNWLRVHPCGERCRAAVGTAVLGSGFFYTHPGPSLLTLLQTRVPWVEIMGAGGVRDIWDNTIRTNQWLGSPHWFHILMGSLMAYAQPPDYARIVDAVNALPDLQRAIDVLADLDEHHGLAVWQLVLAGVRR